VIAALPDKKVSGSTGWRGGGKVDAACEVLCLGESDEKFLRLSLVLDAEPDAPNVVVRGFIVVVVVNCQLVQTRVDISQRPSDPWRIKRQLPMSEKLSKTVITAMIKLARILQDLHKSCSPH